MENELFYAPEDGFWQTTDKLTFETACLEPEWPKPGNPFLKKMAESARAKRGLHNIATGDFKQVIGALIEADPHTVFRFMIVPLGRRSLTVSVQLTRTTLAQLPPLKSDNACSLELAMKWMAERYSQYELSCAAEGNYWIHRK